jgi:RNA polymerase sigma factor (TIGR02999 family)
MANLTDKPEQDDSAPQSVQDGADLDHWHLKSEGHSDTSGNLRINGETEGALASRSAADNAARQRTGEVTSLLLDWRNGDRSTLDRLTPIIYDDLLRLARARLRGEGRECSLEPTALVHESYLRLANQIGLDVGSRAHFYSIAANVMRRVLIDCARKRNAMKRNRGVRITLQTDMDSADMPTLDSVVIDDALQNLAAVDERKSQAITLKFFGGLTTEEIATVLGVSVATVGRELRLGQAWLRRELSRVAP